MKRFLFYVIGIAFILLADVGCSPYLESYQPHVKGHLLKPSWFSKVDTNPVAWTQGADTWFFDGEPNSAEKAANYLPMNDAVGITAVRVPAFTRLYLNGSFQVQILGNQERNSVYILGPHFKTRQIQVAIHDKTLSINQVAGSKTRLQDVIVRIGIKDLKELVYLNCGRVTGRDIRSSHLAIQSFGSGDILLDGKMCLAEINQFGTGTVTVIGAYSPRTALHATGNGSIRVSGRVGVNDITHAGNGMIAVVGADTDQLTIQAQDNSLTTVSGYVNLRAITAQHNAAIYLYWVNSPQVSIIQRQSSQIGLAGKARNLSVDLADTAYFDGQFLRACYAYAQTYQWAHANVRASQNPSSGFKFR